MRKITIETFLRDGEGEPKPLGFGGESGAMLLSPRNERSVVNEGSLMVFVGGWVGGVSFAEQSETTKQGAGILPIDQVFTNITSSCFSSMG